MSYKALYICIACSLVSGYSRADELSDVKMPATMQNARLFHSENGFTVVQDGNEKNIQSCFVSPDIRNISPELLGKFIAADNYLKLSELNNVNGSVDYKLDACSRLRGGGLTGAWLGAIAGKAVVHFVGHGAILLAGACTGPAMPVTVAALEAALLPTVIEPASNVAAIAGGIAGGVATGPV